MACGSKGKAVTLPQTLNLATGKESMCQTGFSNAIWGKVTCSYAKSASSFTNTKFGAIVKDAWPFVNLKSTRSKTEAKEVIEIDDNDDNEQRNLVDNDNDNNDDDNDNNDNEDDNDKDEDNEDNDDKDCKLFLPFHDLTNMIF